MRSTISRLSIPVLVAIAGLLVPLPAQEAAEVGEWVDLFDGKTLKGWTRLNGTAKYRVVDGTIEGTTVKGSPNSFLCTDRFYGDYELVFEVKLFDDALNSGVQIRSHSYPAYRKGRVHGYQVEVSTNGNAGFIYDEARRGWLADLSKNKLARDAFKPEQWNHFRIQANGDQIKTWINGVHAVTLRDSMDTSGFIGLQVHGQGKDKGRAGKQARWRNIRIKEL